MLWPRELSFLISKVDGDQASQMERQSTTAMARVKEYKGKLGGRHALTSIQVSQEAFMIISVNPNREGGYFPELAHDVKTTDALTHQPRGSTHTALYGIYTGIYPPGIYIPVYYIPVVYIYIYC